MTTSTIVSNTYQQAVNQFHCQEDHPTLQQVTPVMGESQITSRITNHFNQNHKSNQITMSVKCKKFPI